jgi:hypothetical protein
VSDAPGREVLAELTPAQGDFRLPIGTYSIERVLGTAVCWPDRFQVRTNTQTVVWIGEAQSLDVRVVGPEGQPVPGAVVTWNQTARPDPGSRTQQEDSKSAPVASTDEDGRASIQLAGPVLKGQVMVMAQGFIADSIALANRVETELVVVLRPATGEVRIGSLLDCDTGQPAEGISVYDSAGRHLAVSGAEGQLVLPVGLASPGGLRVQSDRSAECWVERPSSDGFQLCSVPLVRLHVATGGSVSRVDVNASMVRAPEVAGVEVVQPVITTSAQDGNGIDLALPRGARVLILASTPAGQSAAFDLVVPATETTVEIPWDSGSKGFQLTVQSISGGSVQVDATYPGQSKLVLRTTSGEPVTLPRADILGKVLVQAAGHVPVLLRRIPNSPSDPWGRLVIELEPASAFDLALVDDQAQPIPRVRVRFEDQQTSSASRDFPELLGAKPTGHGAWSIRSPMDASAVSGADGIARVGSLRTGLHFVSMRCPEELHAAGVDLYQLPFRPLFVPPGRSSGTWTIPAPRRVLLQAFDATTGLPVRELAISIQGGLANATAETMSNVWQGVVPSRSSHLSVTAPGYKRLELSLAQAAAGPVRRLVLRADLVPGSMGSITLEGPEAELLYGKSLRLVAEDLIDGTWVVRWNGRVEVRSDGSVPFHMPVAEAHLSLFGGDMHPGFELRPSRQRWREGQDVVFQFRRIAADDR